MKKIFVFLLALITVNLNEWGYASSSISVLSETTQSSPGFNFKVEETSAHNKNLFHFANALTLTADKKTYAKQKVLVDAYHNINIVNHTNKPQIYEHRYILFCANYYGQYVRRIEVPPGASFNHNYHSSGTVNQNIPGLYGIHASTQICGESNIFHEAHAILNVLR